MRSAISGECVSGLNYRVNIKKGRPLLRQPLTNMFKQTYFFFFFFTVSSLASSSSSITTSTFFVITFTSLP
jgi:hypothetical protein